MWLSAQSSVSDVVEQGLSLEMVKSAIIMLRFIEDFHSIFKKPSTRLPKSPVESKIDAGNMSASLFVGENDNT